MPSRPSRSRAPGGVVLVIGHDATNRGAGHGGPQDPAILYGPDEVVAPARPRRRRQGGAGAAAGAD